MIGHALQNLRPLACAGLLEVGERLAILAHRFQLLLQSLSVVRLLDLPQHQLHLALDIVQGFVQFCHGGAVLIALVVLASDAQVLGVLMDDRDVAQLVATVDDAVHAQPTRQGNGQGQQQYQAEAQPQFAIDAHIAQ
ncbi:hypothetical protein D9M71_593250 [compost metagenome]